MLRLTLASAGRATRALLTWRLSRHPERCREIYHVLRRYRLHQVVAQLGLHHQHDEEPNQPVLAAGHVLGARKRGGLLPSDQPPGARRAPIGRDAPVRR